MRLLSIAAAVFFVAGDASAGHDSIALDQRKEHVEVAVNPTEEADGWAFSGLVSGYAIPDDKDYLSPVFTADRGGLHLEGRYNYEDFDTASVWAGWNLSCGEKLIFDFTPMVGWVFGQTSGIAPGWRLGLSRGAVEFTSEAEFVFDTDDSENNFFYMWSELTWSPADWMWVGLAGQRSRIFQSELDIQRGFLIGFSARRMNFTAYMFNWGWTDPTFVLAVGVDF